MKTVLLSIVGGIVGGVACYGFLAYNDGFKTESAKPGFVTQSVGFGGNQVVDSRGESVIAETRNENTESSANCPGLTITGPTPVGSVGVGQPQQSNPWYATYGTYSFQEGGPRTISCNGQSNYIDTNIKTIGGRSTQHKSPVTFDKISAGNYLLECFNGIGSGSTDGPCLYNIHVTDYPIDENGCHDGGCDW